MRSMKLFNNTLTWVLLVTWSFTSSLVFAHGGAHVHGLIRMDLAIDGKTLTVQIEAPLDSLLGLNTAHAPQRKSRQQKQCSSK